MYDLGKIEATSDRVLWIERTNRVLQQDSI